MGKSRPSIATEIEIHCRQVLKNCKQDGHYKDGVFPSTADAVYHAISSLTGNIVAIIDNRKLKRKNLNP